MGDLGGFFKSMLMQISDEMEDDNKANKRKIQEAIDKYWDACKYPRKKKKKMRKEAQIDYSFWININNWYEKEFGFLKL
jgi:hypothetical protein